MRTTALRQAIEALQYHKANPPKSQQMEGYLWGLEVALNRLFLLLPIEEGDIKDAYEKGYVKRICEQLDSALSGNGHGMSSSYIQKDLDASKENYFTSTYKQ